MFQDKLSMVPPLGGSMAWHQEQPEHIELRQLRHHTKNALQRILIQVAEAPGLGKDVKGRALLADLERRIRLSARLSDALFGLTSAPAPLGMRLDDLGQSMIELLADGDQIITVATRTVGVCPASLEGVVIRVAHELIGNAVKHGMPMRIVGKIEIVVESGLDRVELRVTDDGWGICLGEDGVGREPKHRDARGDGLRIARLLAAQHGGLIDLRRLQCQTVATMVLPWPGMVGRRV